MKKKCLSKLSKFSLGLAVPNSNSNIMTANLTSELGHNYRLGKTIAAL
jgi:hypothetical protein